ncbi:thioesterase II family protein [Sphaerisporangium perillae]|uniref:thioesterase II family protein n=1 Tax=Sphaerisporangium perillae TaxID=2935860 RepID=UPI00200D6783|nr:alpha/beta fold hydrolase [Sphaerisporangium perillae]
MATTSQRWISWRQQNPAAPVRLYCLPYAGGGTRMFDSWADALGPGVEVCPVVLPGREDRIGEEPVARLEELLPMLIDGLAPTMTKPFALYGHSMGGLIAFELALRLCEKGNDLPLHVYLSGCGPAPIPEGRRHHLLPDEDFIEELRRMNGTPPEFFEDRDLVDLLLPTIRADFELSETSAAREGALLPVPITAFAGEQDPSAPADQVREWRAHAGAGFDFHTYRGDHFFVHDCPEMLGVVRETLPRS